MRGIYDKNQNETSTPHAWLLTLDNFVVDITGDQFKNHLPPLKNCEPVYVGTENRFYKSFCSRRIVDNFYGIDQLGSGSHSRLFDLYDTISQLL